MTTIDKSMKWEAWREGNRWVADCRAVRTKIITEGSYEELIRDVCLLIRELFEDADQELAGRWGFKLVFDGNPRIDIPFDIVVRR